MTSPAAIKKLYYEKISVNTFAKSVLFIIIMAVSFTTVFLMQQSEALTENLLKKGGLLAELLAYNAKLCVFTENKDICSESGKGLLQQEDIHAVLIFTLDGKLLVKNEKQAQKPLGSGEGPDYKIIEQIKMNIAKGRSPVYFEDAGAELHFWAPVILVSKSSTEEALFIEGKILPERERIVGYVELIIGKEGLDKQFKVLLYRGFLMGTVFLIVGFAATYYAVREITSPIAKLSAASVEIGRGNLDVHVKVTSRDEIGRLSQAFNKMAMDLKESERKYKELNEELELKVRERTGQLLLAQEALLRKEKLAVLGQLSGSVSHELRSPLGVMNNAVYYLKTVLSGSSEKVGEYLNILKSEIDNSERIISDLLDFSRTRPPQAKPVTVNELLGQSLARCLVPGNVCVEMDIPADLPEVFADPFQMAQVFQNLIANGIQAMPEGGVLRVQARLIAECGLRNVEFEVQKSQSEIRNLKSAIEISVSDTGSGISPENMKKIFQPLFTTKARGIGLGLVVVKNLTEANGGKVCVDSEIGKGTVFTVTLPAAED